MSWLSNLWNLLSKGIPSLARFVGSIRLWLTRSRWGNALLFYLGGAVGGVLLRIVEFLGISFVAYKWASPALVQYVAGPMLGMPAQWQAMLSMTRIDDALTVMLSAVVYRASLQIRVVRHPNFMRGAT